MKSTSYIFEQLAAADQAADWNMQATLDAAKRHQERMGKIVAWSSLAAIEARRIEHEKQGAAAADKGLALAELARKQQDEWLVVPPHGSHTSLRVKSK